MRSRKRRSIVVLGMMTKMPVPGVVWQTAHYLVGLRRLGYDVTYVEAHARTPSMFVPGTDDAGTRRAARFLDDVLRRFDLADRWALHALHHDGSCLGMERDALFAAYRSADLLLNLCGGTQPRPEHVETNRLVLVLTDPVQVEIELWQKRAETRDFLEAHAAIFTFGENYGSPGCSLPTSPEYDPIPTRQPVVLDFWENEPGHGHAYTTVANWSQPFRNLRYQNEMYYWSKDREFEKFIDLPMRSGALFELALASFRPEDRARLEKHGWYVRDAAALGFDSDAYRSFVRDSRGEFTVAKDQNVRFRSGWFSDRSATYLAAGRPVITQDTGFADILPTGAGLFPVSTVDDALGALEVIEHDYGAARVAARGIAREYFDYRVVLPRMLAECGVEGPARRFSTAGESRGARSPADGASVVDLGGAGGIPETLVLEPVSRRPLRLQPETKAVLEARPVPTQVAPPVAIDGLGPADTVSIVVVTHDKLSLTRLCVESVLAHTRHPAYEIVIVDNGSTDGTPSYLRDLAAAHRHVRVILNPFNEGFPTACNQGARATAGTVLVFLNNDTVVPPGWLTDLISPLEDATLGAVNPVTNRIGTPAEVGGLDYTTYGGFLRYAADRAQSRAGVLRPTRMLAFFCLALKRSTWNDVGELDEGYERGLFEDDDYSVRLERAGLGLACVEGVLVHHFGQASFGDLVSDGRYGDLYRRNRDRFEEKWGAGSLFREAAPDATYERLLETVRHEVHRHVPEGAIVAIVSRGDDRLLDLDTATGWHFPRLDDGRYAGHYPADGAEAVELLEQTRRDGATHFLVPAPAVWWLDHYAQLRAHLDAACAVVARSDDLILYRLQARPGGRAASAVSSSVSAGSRPRPVFVIGSPRSGTSVMTWALGQHSNLYPLEETVWFGRFHSGSVQAYNLGSSRGDLSQLSAMGIERGEFMEDLGTAIDAMIRRHRSWPEHPVAADRTYARARRPDDPKDRWVDGTPENSFHVAALAELFPEASFIHLVREPHLVARSLQRFHQIGGRQHSTDEAYRRWITHVRACLEAEQSLGPERVLRVLHRDLADAPEGVLRSCLHFLGEAYAPECLLPLEERINSSGQMSLPEGTHPDAPDPEVLAEAEALANEVFFSAEDAA